MKKTKLTRSLLAACAAAAAAARQAEAEAAAAAAAQAQADAEARATAAEAAQAAAEAERATALALQAAAENDAEAARMAEAAAEAARAEAAAAKATADAAAAAALAAQAEAEARATAAEAARATAEGDAEAARMAQEAAEMAKMQAEEAAEAAEMAKMQAEEAAEAAKMAQMEAERERDAAIAAREGLEEEDERTQAQKDSDAAKALLAVLVDATANLGGADGTTPVHTAPSPTVSVSTDGMLMAEATDYDMSDMAPDMIEGWRGAVLTNEEGDTATVYTDIGNDGTQTLLDRYESNRPNPPTSPDRTWDIGLNDNTEGEVPWSAVMRPDDEATVSGGTATNPVLTFMGTVHNIPGTFSCTGSTCVPPDRFSDGSVANAATGDWTFVPDEGVATYTDDPQYVTFGWWLSKGANGEPDDLTLITSAPGMGVARTGAAGTIRGSATYEGGAAGKYAFASTSDATYTGGHFTAMATLMVDFDADLDPGTAGDDNAGVTLSGTIDNFMTGDMARPDWSVALMVDGDGATSDSTTIPMTDLIADTDATMMTEWSTGGAVMGTGMWTPTWYGGADGEHPMAVTGTFNAHIGAADGVAVGRLQGAFGANKQ